MPKATTKTARSLYDLIEEFNEDLAEYFKEDVPLENWEDELLTKAEELRKEASILIDETDSSYGK